MPDDSNSNGAAEIKTPLFSASLRGKDVQIRDIIVLIILLTTAMTAYAIYEHKTDDRATRAEFVAAIKEMTAAQKDSVQAQRVMNCILALPQNERQTQLPVCERIAR